MIFTTQECCSDGSCLLCRCDWNELADRMRAVLKMPMQCVVCFEVFVPTNGNRYCSVICRKAFWNLHDRGSGRPRRTNRSRRDGDGARDLI